MPTLEEATREIDSSLFEREPVSNATDLTPPPVVNQDTLYSIRSNVNLRSPSPPINVSPDNLRQYYRGGQAPQFRTLSPPTLAAQAAAAGGATQTTVLVSGSTSSSTTALSGSLTAGVVTPSLNVGQVYPTILQMAKAFMVLGFGINTTARVELYKTAASQNADLSRPITQPVPIGTKHGIICDLTFNNSNEFSWICSPDFPGSNGDSPQTTSVYITITNIGAAAAPISLTIIYVPLES